MKSKWTNVGNYAFYTALILEILYVLIDKSEYILPYETWFFRLTFLFFIVKIAATQYTLKEWGVIFLMGLLGLISFAVTDREEIIRIVAFVAAIKGTDIGKVLKITFWETLAGCIVIILLSITGIYGAASVTGFFRGGGIEETRYCLGMGHPNALHCMFFALLVLGMATYREKMKWFAYVLCMLLNIGVYLLTDSRTGMLVCTAAIFLAVFLEYAKKWRERKILYVLAVLAIIACAVLTVIIAVYGVEIPILRQIDIRINGRFQWGKTGGGIEYWSLFSSPENQNYFDMGFLRIFYWYGIIPALVYIGLLCAVLWSCRKQKAYGAFLVILAFSVYTLIEAHAVSVYIGRNYVLLFIGAMWYTILGQKNQEEEYFFRMFRLFSKS